MAEPVYRHAHDLDALGDAAPAQGVPGKMPVTARLSGRQQIVFRVESAEAARELAGALGPRDGNGVASGADAAVDRAAGSSGQALPGDVRDRFESSLGADLSSVRVHTGVESQRAAGAVGARAYTTGQDIHFGAGQYDPSSAFGVHLLAHEVAHTVQQQAGAPVRQHKLEVSTPGDAAEVEADRAADAMLAGSPAQLATVSGATERSVFRDPEKKPFPGDNPLLNGPSHWKPDPTDPFEQPATNWGAFPAAAAVTDAAPPPFKRDVFIGPGPKPYRSQFGESYSGGGPDGNATLLPHQLPKANRCNAAFAASYAALASTAETAYPQLTLHFRGDKELADGDLHALLGWDKTAGAGDLSSVAAGQTGNTGVSVSDLFKNKDGTVDNDAHVDTSHDKSKNAGLVEARRQVTVADRDATSAIKKYLLQVDATMVAALEVKNAVGEVDIKLLKAEGKGLDDQKTKLESQKSSTGKAIDTVVKVVQAGTKLGFAAAKGDAASIGGAVADTTEWFLGELFKASVNSTLDSQIRAVNAQIAAVSIQVDTAEVQLINDKIDTKVKAQKVASGMLVQLREDAVIAAGKAQTAYNTFAELAGKSAGGGAGNQKRVESAIKAIPKVGLLVGRLAEINGAIVLPPYSDDSGIGYNAVASIANEGFTPHYCLLKGYKPKFVREFETWGARLKSLKAIGEGFAPTPAKPS